jgi:hypothetical protein
MPIVFRRICASRLDSPIASSKLVSAMRQDERVVTQLPLTELWDANGVVAMM